jgi:hypothetical protein
MVGVSKEWLPRAEVTGGSGSVTLRLRLSGVSANDYSPYSFTIEGTSKTGGSDRKTVNLTVTS